MDKTIRFILLVLIVLVILSSFSTLWFFMEKEMLNVEYTTLEGLFKANVANMNKLSKRTEALTVENVSLKSKVETVEEALAVLETKNKDLEFQCEAVLDEVDGMNKELVRVRKGKFFLEKKLKHLTSKGFVAKYKDIKKENRFLKTKMSGLEKSFDKLKSVVAKKEKQKEVRAEAYHTPDEVELPPIILEGGPRRLAKLTTASPFEHINKTLSSRGRVVTINRQHNFVVINLGRENGIETGNRFSVHKGNNIVGYIEVIQTRNKIAAADIKDVKKGSSIEIDDIVVKQ